jgi:hypothetical protein
MTRALIVAAVLITFIPACTGTPAAAGFRSFYGANGAYIGGAITRNGHTTYTNAGGRYIGSSITRGRTTVIYDRTGSRAGSSTRTGR